MTNEYGENFTGPEFKRGTLAKADQPFFTIMNFQQSNNNRETTNNPTEVQL